MYSIILPITRCKNRLNDANTLSLIYFSNNQYTNLDMAEVDTRLYKPGRSWYRPKARGQYHFLQVCTHPAATDVNVNSYFILVLDKRFLWNPRCHFSLTNRRPALLRVHMLVYAACSSAVPLRCHSFNVTLLPSWNNLLFLVNMWFINQWIAPKTSSYSSCDCFCTDFEPVA